LSRFFCNRPIGAILLATTLLFLVRMTAAAQEQAPHSVYQESGTSAHPAQASQEATSQPTLSAQLAKESREAAGEDDTEQFKHSASVRLVAKLTGLSLQHAYWLSIVVNFAVVAGLIFWISRKKLPGLFRDRTAHIQKAMEEARKASQEANRRLADIETRLSLLDVEIGQMHMVAEKEAEAEEQRVKAAAEEEARKIVESAEQEISAAVKSARRELTAYAADLAVSLAKKQVSVDSATDQALVRDFAAQLTPDAQGDRKGRS